MPTCRRPNSRKPTWSQRPHDRGDSMTTGAPSRPALLVVGHGTRSAAGVAEFIALVDRVRFRAGGLPVGGGFIELSRPPLTDAVSQLVAAGERHFGVVPLVLVAAGHAKGDIPAAAPRRGARRAGPAGSGAGRADGRSNSRCQGGAAARGRVPPGAAADTTVLL